MSRTVLDASAVLALLNGEPGAERVAQVLDTSVQSGAVNLAEVLTRLIDRGLSMDEARTAVDALRVPVYPFDAALAERAALLRPATRAAGLSLGDRACLALGQLTQARVLTADRVWRDLGLAIEIECIRP